jgi:hypothetical protein
VLAVAFSRRKAIVGCLSLAAFHLHLMCDVVGARGPDGYSWPIPYLQPFSSHLQLEWEGQWYLNAWPNFAVAGAALGLIFYLTWKRGHSVLSLFSLRADRAFVSALRQRIPARSNPAKVR